VIGPGTAVYKYQMGGSKKMEPDSS